MTNHPLYRQFGYLLGYLLVCSAIEAAEAPTTESIVEKLATVETLFYAWISCVGAFGVLFSMRKAFHYYSLPDNAKISGTENNGALWLVGLILSVVLMVFPWTKKFMLHAAHPEMNDTILNTLSVNESFTNYQTINISNGLSRYVPEDTLALGLVVSFMLGMYAIYHGLTLAKKAALYGTEMAQSSLRFKGKEIAISIISGALLLRLDITECKVVTWVFEAPEYCLSSL